MAIRTEDTIIKHKDIVEIRMVTVSRAVDIFREVGRINNIAPYEPRTYGDYLRWVAWRAEQRKKRREERNKSKVV